MLRGMRPILTSALFVLACSDCVHGSTVASFAQTGGINAQNVVVGDNIARAFVVTGKTELATIDDANIKAITDYMTAQWKQPTSIVTCNYSEHFCATEIGGKVRKAKEGLESVAKFVGEKFGINGVNILTCEREDMVPYRCFVIGEKLVALENIAAPATISRVITGGQWKQIQEAKQQSTESQK